MSFQLDYDLRQPNEYKNNEQWLTLFSIDRLACSKCGKAPARFYSQLHRIASCVDSVCRDEMAQFVDSNPQKWQIPPDPAPPVELKDDPNWEKK